LIIECLANIQNTTRSGDERHEQKDEFEKIKLTCRRHLLTLQLVGRTAAGDSAACRTPKILL